MAQYLVDAIASGLVTALFTAPDPPELWSLLTFGVMTVVFLVLTGQTPGMRLLGLRLAHPQPEQRLALWRAVVRTGLLTLLLPALVVDSDGRGLHDRLTDTAVVRER
ncbi:RDD family protein [Modestobacter versicolor]|uniref:RDD family protein n=1 Tax=Modestobacter versicolor TaxID=429133 RepID=UPI003CCD6F68